MKASMPQPRPIPQFSNHSLLRMAQRGIDAPEILATMRYGRKQHVRGALVHVIGRKEVRQAEKTGRNLRDYEGIHVVCSPDRTVLTVYRNRHLNIRGKRLRRLRMWVSQPG